MASKFTKLDGYCYFCMKPSHGVHHFLFGKDRNNADKDGIYAPICDDCHVTGKYRIHDNPLAEDLSKKLGEAMWLVWELAEQDEATVNEAIDKFRKRYGQSYL